MKIGRRITRNLGSIFGSPRPWLFLVGGVLAAGLLVEGASKLVDAYVNEQPWQAGAWTLGAGLLLLIVALSFINLPRFVAAINKALFYPDLSHTTVAVEEQVPRRKGLVVLVSLGDYTAAASALDYHAWNLVPGSQPVLTHCWLITGPGEGDNSSQANAERIKRELEARGITAEIWPLTDADDVQETFQKVKTIFQVAATKYKLAKEEMIVDYTGGTKSMTGGMILAAIAEGIDLQYMKPNLYLDDGRADRAADSRPRFVTIDFVKVAEDE
jgi:hypothetical protein